MSREVAAIAGRLSLRPPQRESLEILAAVSELIPLTKDQDVAAALGRVQEAYPSVEDFERDFPSLCFHLATGVGKTRLMGAFIAWLRRVKGARHFFVLAPNLTIYNKLIADFTPGNRKYVFQGLAEFAINPPEIITGDNWESGRALRGDLFGEGDVNINVFNISKINIESRRGNVPRVKRLNEYIGESYFEYLSKLPDLVLLMDESHRYRAAAGMQAINELNPVIGLELTATPQVEGGGRIPRPFKNVIYSYPLAHALRDGFVKEPAVATRQNFSAAGMTEEALETLKLQDGVRIHESVKAELETYALRAGIAKVKPFMLVVATDTTHAAEIEARIKNEDFFGGRYADKVIQVHSNQRGEEKEEVVERLLAVEDPAEPTEIVIHVNMLKEGWDVTNLYTIVPLRAANSRTLVEQAIGRGLRLPYGKRTGVSAVDRLTIVAHDRFEEIIDEANRGDSPIRFVPVFVGGEDVPESGKIVVHTPSPSDQMLGGGEAGASDGARPAMEFANAEEREVARVVVEVVQSKFASYPSPAALLQPVQRAEVLRQVKEAMTTSQGTLELESPQQVEAMVERVIEELALRIIEVPRITVVPTGEVKNGYHDFDLDTTGIALQPVEEHILIQHLHDHRRETLAQGSIGVGEARLEDYLVRALVGKPDVSYDEHADLLYKLAGQLIGHLRSYLQNDDDVSNVLRYYERTLGDLVYQQLTGHYWEETPGYEAHVSLGFERLPAQSATSANGETVRNVRIRPAELSRIRSMRFGMFGKSIYPEARFDSDTERAMAALIDDTPEVIKWFKPSGPPPRIYATAGGSLYEPDFVVETTSQKFLIETKAANEMNDTDVVAKAKAAVTWCRHASEYANQHGGKAWTYVLIPHDQVTAAATLAGLVTRFAQQGTFESGDA
ncbi:MAG TPA: DEAD/DEAH box helicase family protein [Gemmatimonadales bacterium]|nr:DEAD/DEAH box helicase family protein [Gemmatimonadales bacterium]